MENNNKFTIMKKATKRNLKFTKVSIAIIDKLTEKSLKGGTDPISEDLNTDLPGAYRMSDLPDQNGICYQIH